jgi:hypothetical protein
LYEEWSQVKRPQFRFFHHLCEARSLHPSLSVFHHGSCNGRRSSTPRAPLVGMCLFGATCISFEDAARNKFVNEASCPANRVSVIVQSGEPGPPVEPPPEVARDAERLAIWRMNDDARRTSIARETYYVVRGCNEGHIYTCYRFNRNACCPVCTETSRPQPVVGDRP